MSATHSTALRIAASHPALAGHLLGHPVVPGVVLLEHVAAALRARRGRSVVRIAARFLHVLLPDEDAVIALGDAPAGVRFSVTRADSIALARGVLGTAA